MFHNPFSFKGRIRRTEYAISFVILIFFRILLEIAAEENNSGFTIVILLFLIPVMWFSLAQGTKRCHDLGKSGIWQIIPFYVFILIFKEGRFGMNNYGLDPKRQIDNKDKIPA